MYKKHLASDCGVTESTRLMSQLEKYHDRINDEPARQILPKSYEIESSHLNH